MCMFVKKDHLVGLFSERDRTWAATWVGRGWVVKRVLASDKVYSIVKTLLRNIGHEKKIKTL